jgi:hypothetical protein
MLPATTGRRIEAAAFSKTNAGSVRDGIWVVIGNRESGMGFLLVD